jgi:predicted nucleic acid-binding protein
MLIVEVVQHRARHYFLSQTELGEVQGCCRDAKDEWVLALALAANAEVIVSSDRDLLVLHPWRGIAILTPVQFLEQFAV